MRDKRAVLAEVMPRIRREAMIGVGGSAVVTLSIMVARRVGRLQRTEPLDVMLMALFLVVVGGPSFRHARAALEARPWEEPRDQDALLVLVLAGGAVVIPWLYAVVLLGWIAFGTI